VEKKGDENRKGFDVLAKNIVQGDRDLLQQAISNILDNAGRYAKSPSVVRVAAGITGSGWFHVSVYNKPFFRPTNPEMWKLHNALTFALLPPETTT
jgi:signal transduction histidine kinase